MGRRIFATAALGAVLGTGALAAPAGAATTRVVDKNAGPYTTITAAILAADPGDTIEVHAGNYDEQLWIPKDDITVKGTPGTVGVTATSPFVVSLMGARDVLDGIYVAGGPGGVHIEGDDAVVRNAAIVSDDRGLDVRGAGSVTIDHTMVRTSGLFSRALVGEHQEVGTQAVSVLSSILVGGRMGTTIDVMTGEAGDISSRGPAALTLVHSTVSGSPAALRTARAGMGGEISAKAYNSIVHGDAPGLADGGGNDLTTADSATFRNGPALDFHLRADAPAVGRAIPLPSDVPAPRLDFDGAAIPPVGGAAGALQFHSRPPSASLTASTDTARQFAPVTFDASGSSDPDPGGRIASYRWQLGAETVTTTEPVLRHAFAAVGTVTVSVRVTDVNGDEAVSRPVSVSVTDAVVPALRITSPRDKAKLHRYKTVKRNGKKRRVVNVLRFGGRVTDAGGVARVELTLQQLPAKTKAIKNAKPATTCTFLDPARRLAVARACADPPVIRAALKGDAWSWSTPSRLAVPTGSWQLTARATDRAGNLATSVLHFTIT
jgi:PKD repeat protein